VHAVALLALTTVISGIPERDKNGRPHIRSESAIVRWGDTGEVILEKDADRVRPIASITKLLSTLILSKEGLPPDEWITLEEQDKDRLKWSKSKLKIARAYRPLDLFAAALVISENRAVYALVRAKSPNRATFVERMNATAKELGMAHSTFRDPAGVDPANVSTARDLLALLDAVAENEMVAKYAALDRLEITDKEERIMRFGSTNRLARSARWEVVLGKTGYTVEAGRTLVLRVMLGGRPLDLVFLGSREMQSVFGDAGRVRRWLEQKQLASQKVVQTAG
jgi:serine-type D-Ala-D-Ala endopeptidase (penicillin-binding protein 7)